jgi:uncharacterized protein
VAALHESVVSCLAHDVLHLIVMPTEACNYRCFYCYEDFRLGRMEPRVVRGIKNLLADRAEELSHLTLSWFGGEPLLARDLIEDVMRHVGRLRVEHPRMRVESDVTTNGHHLGRRVFERLLALGVDKYQVSFDGPPEWHDRVRRQAGGGGTFDRIWGNLASLRAVRGDFQVQVRVHVDRENHRAMPAFIDRYAEHFGSDGRFQLFLRKLSRYGGPNDSALAVLDDGEECGAVLGELWAYADRRGVARFDGFQETTSCYAARANSFVVRADGRVNKCTVVLDHPRNQVGRLHESGRLQLESGRMLDWMRGLSAGDALQMLCPMRGLADDALDPPAARPASLSAAAR